MPADCPSYGWKDPGCAYSFLYEANDADRLLFLGRAAVLPFALLLGWVVFLWSRQLFGREAALGALFLYSFEPNILAHSGLVTTDMAAACFIFATIYGFYRFVQRVSLMSLAIAGVALGLALVTKFSALMLFPMLLVLAAAVVIIHAPVELRLAGVSPSQVLGRTGKLLILLGAVAVMSVLAFGTIWSVYRFRSEGLVLPKQGESPQGERGPVARLETRLLPKPYLDGLAKVSTSLERPSFLLGERSTTGWWHYFIVTFLLKTPLPLLILLALTPLCLRPLWHASPIAVSFLLVPVFVYFGAASWSRFNIGHRHILPILPFLIVMTSSLVPWVLHRRTFAKAGLAIAAGWFLVSSVSVFPHYLAYFNELAGGPENGYKYLVDSNLDWGQDLKGLKRYLEKQGIQRLWLSYFGTASPAYYGITYNYLPSYWIVRPNSDTEPTPYVAISATNLQGVYLPVLGLDPTYFEAFKDRQPIAKIGYSIFLYRLDESRRPWVGRLRLARLCPPPPSRCP
jgi:4-amino-4-deoxy-L-arabinose transferase-like glycosyltransferase